MRNIALEYVADAAERRQRLAEASRHAEAQFREYITQAATVGCSYSQIAEAAGITKARVGQIVKSARSHARRRP